MASPFSFSLLPHKAINLCVLLLLLCPLSSAFDVSSACPHVLTTSTIKTKPRPNGTFLAVVPWKVGFEQFAQLNPHSCLIDGFSVQLFREALSRIHPHPPHFKFVLHGDGNATPAYDDMIDMVAKGEVDAVVADLTITKERMEKVGFSMPYLPSTLVMVTPFRYGSAGTLWDFLKPFSRPLWLTLLGAFVATGAALYLLENKNPDFSATAPPKKRHTSLDAPPPPPPPPSPDPSSHGASPPVHAAPAPTHHHPSAPTVAAYPLPSDTSSFQRPGPPIYDQASHKRRILNAYWFTSLCVFAAQQESVRTHLGRFITVLWLFVMLIFNSSYTASLASLLSAQKQYPTIGGFQILLNDKNISVGYQEGSFMKDYLNKSHIDQYRLKSFTSEGDFAKALNEGNLKPDGVGAVLDELPYIQILLQLECFLTKDSNDDNLPSFGGFGFAFHKNSPLIEEVSKMIVAMQEDGTLQRLQNGWRIGGGKIDRCSSGDEPSHLRLRSFGGLFSILCGVYVVCILWHLFVKTIQSNKERRRFITTTFACVQHGCTILQRASSSRGLSKVSDVSLESRQG